MHSPDMKTPASAVWALGLTQILGYGTLFYSFSILAPAMAQEFSLPQQWMFGVLSAALFLSSLVAPIAGRWADRFGAGRVMTAGSLAASAALAACALSPGPAGFVTALVAMELASCFVLYSTAFTAIVQIGPVGAQRSITHVTLIAGFASTLFWPLTSLLHEHLTWREVYLLFAAINLLVCLPIHAWLIRFSGHRRSMPVAGASTAPDEHTPIGAAPGKAVFALMLAGFAIEGFVLSAILLHMVPLLSVLGLGATGVMVSAFFGPSQVASRLINMIFGGKLPQTLLAIVSALLLASGLLTLVLTSPAIAGVAAFAILFGLGSGLNSIVSGTLPLELFGRAGYGARMGWITGARQFCSSFAPFVFAFMMAQWSVAISLWSLIAIGTAGVATFVAIFVIQRASSRKA